MYPAKILKDGPPVGGKYADLNEMIMDADGFAGVFPEHKFEIVKRIQGLGHLWYVLTFSVFLSSFSYLSFFLSLQRYDW